MLKIKNLSASVGEKKILDGVNLSLEQGNVYVIMGPNGSGKSTLANVIAGNPRYEVDGGKITFNEEDILEMKPSDRAKKGIFMSFQYPSEVPGVTIFNFLKSAYSHLNDRKITSIGFKRIMDEKLKLFDLKNDFFKRYLNQGFSGGEKKKSEMLQMSILNPRLAILDETDSGLDIDSLRILSEGINKILAEDPTKTILIITHYKRILEYIKPNHVFVMSHGRVVLEGGPEIVDELEKKGYGWINKKRSEKSIL